MSAKAGASAAPVPLRQRISPLDSGMRQRRAIYAAFLRMMLKERIKQLHGHNENKKNAGRESK